MRDVTVHNVTDFVESIRETYLDNTEDVPFRRRILLFRGHHNRSFEITPSIARYSNEDLCFYERNLIEMAKFRLPNVFTNGLQPVELLSLLQHYGIPTRLLDVTENALVALYFACRNDSESDGEVIVFEYKEDAVANYPIVNGIADSYRFLRASIQSVQSFYKSIIGQPYFAEQMYAHGLFSQNNNLSPEEWIEKCCMNPLFIYAPIRSTRQLMQSGRYLLFPNSIITWNDELQFESKINPMPKDHDCVVKLIKIPFDSKEEIMNELQLFGITSGRLFEDSIDAVCRDIKDALAISTDEK